MRWVEGLLLNEFVQTNLAKPAMLRALTQIWVRMARRLREADLAHADLQHGNVLLVPSSKNSSLLVRLIDYDGMFVPALAQKKSGEVGHPNYQHPQRARLGIYNREVDRFPLLVVATALRALAVDGKALWERYDNGDNLLFKESDLTAPEGSALIAELRRSSDALVQALTAKLVWSCHEEMDQTPLLDELLAEDKPAGTAAASQGITVPSAVPSATPVPASSEWNFTAKPAPAPRSGRPSRGR
jgi:hypothetical protein